MGTSIIGNGIDEGILLSTGNVRNLFAGIYSVQLPRPKEPTSVENVSRPGPLYMAFD